MALLSGLVILVVTMILVGLFYIVLKSLFALSTILTLTIAIMIPFIVLVQPWAELVIVIVLFVLVSLKIKQEVS